MDATGYWMWSKRKSDLMNPHIPAPAALNPYGDGDSWEEQAFAEDTAGTLGGCVWPPRSYSCTFCRREFRSAQALGGHMNVHRRDRARLKQSPVPDRTETTHFSNHSPSFHSPYPSQMCTLLYNNPNPKLSDSESLIRSSSSPDSKLSCEEKISSLSFFSPLVQKFEKDNLLVSTLPPPWWRSIGQKSDLAVLDSIWDEEKRSTGSPSHARVETEDGVTEDLLTNLSLVVCHGTQANAVYEEEAGSCKRRRIHEAKSSSYCTKLSAVDRCMPRLEVLKHNSGLVEEVLDLELRLGDASKVK